VTRGCRLALVGAAFAFGTFAPASTAAAAGDKADKADKKAACFAAADDGQKLRDEGKLIVAREKFIACAAKGCPAVVTKECNSWLREVERDLPSVSFRALDEQGRETTEVRVSIDRKATSASIEPRAIPLDPGAHVIRFERADGRSVEDKIMLRPGEKNRMVELSFKAPTAVAAQPASAAPTPGATDIAAPAPAGATSSFRIPALAWVGVGVAVVGAVGTAAFAVMANNDSDTLHSTCAPYCPESKRSSVDSKILLANVALGTSLAGLGFAVLVTALENGKSGKDAPKQGARTPSIGIDLSGRVTVQSAF
jgi:hypothetical protein